MNKSIQNIILVTFLALFTNLSRAQSNTSWQLITDSNELTELIKGKALGSKDWIFYFRGDGKLASMQYGSMTVREWSVTENGEVCYAVFSMPDKIIRCGTVEKATSSQPRYRMITESGSFEFEIKAPPADLVNAIIERAGPE